MTVARAWRRRRSALSRFRPSAPAFWPATAALLFGTTLLAVFCSAPAKGAPSAPEFALPRRDTGQVVRRADFAGQIVVLDFFAYWCAPCREASRALETEVQRHYADRKGNPQGIPVRVISVNIEQARPELTDEFIAATGASLVVEDKGGSLLGEFGAEAIPFLVVIDGSRKGPEAPRFEIVHRRAGFAGAAALRKVIDGMGQEGRGPAPSRVALREIFAGPVTQRGDASIEIASASDIFLTESAVRYWHERGRIRIEAGLNYATFGEDYRHFERGDNFGYDEELDERRIGGDATLWGRLSDRVTLLAGGGAYDGFQDYRRVWLNNYYRQRYANPRFPTNPGYRPANPHGWQAQGGLRWEYLPGSAFLEVRGGASFDEVAPGYDEDNVGTGIPTRGQAGLQTTSGSFSTENVLGRRLRSLQEVRLNDTETRQSRVSWQGSLNWAPAERWVGRLYGGYTREEPAYDAFWVGGAVEIEVTSRLTLIAAGHYYHDTGEVLDPLILTSAAPALQSWQATLGVRLTIGRVTLKLSGGPQFTDYEPVAGVSRAFTNLYLDREWGLAQLAVSVPF